MLVFDANSKSSSYFLQISTTPDLRDAVKASITETVRSVLEFGKYVTIIMTEQTQKKGKCVQQNDAGS